MEAPVADDKLPVKSSDKALAKVRWASRARGWVEGAGAVIAAAIIYKFTIYAVVFVVLGGVGFAGYKYMTRDKRGGDDKAEDAKKGKASKKKGKALPKDDLADLDEGGDVDMNDPELAALERELAAMRGE